MFDECIVTRATGEGSLDDQGVWTPPASETVYEGPCWVGKLEALNDPKRRTDQVLTETPFTFVVEWDAAAFAVGDVVGLTKARDPYVGDRAWRITNLPTDTFQVETRLPVEEVVDGG